MKDIREENLDATIHVSGKSVPAVLKTFFIERGNLKLRCGRAELAGIFLEPGQVVKAVVSVNGTDEDWFIVIRTFEASWETPSAPAIQCADFYVMRCPGMP